MEEVIRESEASNTKLINEVVGLNERLQRAEGSLIEERVTHLRDLEKAEHEVRMVSSSFESQV